jgi:hypothetical protein
MIKKLIFLSFLVVGATTFAQKGSGIGIKGGVNYNSNGDFDNNFQNITENPTKNVGFHVGLYGKVDLGPLYVRPEVLYTRTQSEYDSGDLKISKIDVPLLLGIDLIGPLTIFAGPSAQYILTNEFEDFELDEAMDKFTVGAQLGVGFNFENFGIDVRYERGLSKNEIEFTDINVNRVDARQEQVILGLSFKI